MKPLAVSAVLMFAAVAPLIAQNPAPRPEETEVWKPVPSVVTPGKGALEAPSDAIILFNGQDENEWVSTQDHSPAKWDVAGGVLTVNKQAGNIDTKRSFTNYQLHLEWREPEGITGSGQARGNSGVFLVFFFEQKTAYEIQVLDSYNNATYVN